MAGHIRKKKVKDGHVWQIIVEAGTGADGRRRRIYKNVRGTKADAQKLLAKLLTELDNGTYIEPDKITLGDYLRDWMKTYVEANLSPTTVDSYRINVEKHIIPYIGRVPLQELKPMQLQKLYRSLLESGRADGKGGLSARSVRYVHRNIHEALDHAVRMQLVTRNVAELVTLPKARPYKAKVYGEQELIYLMRAAQGTDMELPISLAVALGLRRGELLGLRWGDVDFDQKCITVNNNLVQTRKGSISKDPKSESSNRTIDLPESLIILLKKHKKIQAEYRLLLGRAYNNGGHVCCKPDGSPYCPGYYSKKFKRFLKEKGFSHIRLHDLRHANATLMLKYGVPAKVASTRLGHSSIAITLDLYSHVLSDMQKEVAEKIDTGIFQKLNAQNN
ncbi:MAG: putative prophage phiRv2 integrase [Pelotomaculum sp. PtaU1.Bin035]|nr:MAG: putative prophage phiRv2 integrase [Pelotomaculum sp. PtaU1.Bin035]